MKIPNLPCFSLKLMFALCILIKVTSSSPHNKTSSTALGKDNEKSSRTGRMVFGEKINITEVPYVVYVEMGRNVCAGTIVSRWNVVTAAHCGPKVAGASTVRTGSNLNFKNEHVHAIDEFTPHENFSVDANNKTSKFDIAVITVKTPFEYSNSTQPIGLFNSAKVSNNRAVMSGWGWNERGYSDPYLRKLDVVVEDRQACERAFKDIGWSLNEDQGCTKTKRFSQTPCYGDSGSGIVVDKQLVGVNVFGGGCDAGRPGVPSAYSDIFYYREWLMPLIKFDE